MNANRIYGPRRPLLVETLTAAALIAAPAICSAVTGRWCDMDGVWIEPVTAQVMMTFPSSRMLLRVSR